MNRMNGVSPELMYLLAADRHADLVREAAAERLAALAPHRGRTLRVRIGRYLIRAGQTVGGAAVTPASESRGRMRTAKADGC